MNGQVWLQIAGFFVVAVPVLMILTHLISYLVQGFMAPGTEASKTPAYTDFRQIRKDLLAGVSIEEILDRCNGRFPGEGCQNTNTQVTTPLGKDVETGAQRARKRLEEIRAEMFRSAINKF